MPLLRPEIARSLALHQAVAADWSRNPEWRAVSLARINRWEQQGALHSSYAARWRIWLAKSDDDLVQLIVADTEESCDMRQTSPLSCNLAPRQRWQILKAYRHAALAP